MNLSPEKLLLVGIIALLVLGPNRLPGAARTAGRAVAELRRMSTTLQDEVTSAIGAPRDSLHHAVGELGLGDMRSSLRHSVEEIVTGAHRPAAVSGPSVAEPPGPTGSATGASMSLPVPDDPTLN